MPYVDMSMIGDDVDLIEITSQDEVNRLYEWKEQNTDLVRNVNLHVLHEGCITYGGYYQYFKWEDSIKAFVMLVVFEDKLRISFVFDEDFHAYNEFYPLPIPDEHGVPLTKEEMLQEAFTLHCTTMAYMEHFRQDSECFTSRREGYKKGNRKRDKSKSKKRNVVKVKSRTIHTLIVPDRILDKERKDRSFTRRTESWGVQGHWRHYKSGHSVFIQPYTKGEGRKEGKTYKI